MPPFPIYVMPYPLPIVPSPASCPCYLLNPGQNNTNSAPQYPQNGQNAVASYNPGYTPFGIIGFIPVLFVPYCPGNYSDMNTAQQSFPDAVSVPYNCAQCQAHNRDIYQYLGRVNGGRSFEFDSFKEITSIPQLENVLKNDIKPPRKSLRRIRVHPVVADQVSKANRKSEDTKS